MATPTQRFEANRVYDYSRAATWDAFAQTDRLNWAVGLGAVKFGPLREENGVFYREAASRVAGVTMQWRENAFNWEAEHRYSVVREYDRGPFQNFDFGVRLEDSESGGTRVVLTASVIPRGALGNILVPKLVESLFRRILDYGDRFLSENGEPIRPGENVVTVFAPPEESIKIAPRLNRLGQKLASYPVSQVTVRELMRFVQSASDYDAASFRPYTWARKQSFDREEVLRTCLYAVKAGVLKLRWVLMCPNCRVAKQEFDQLSSLTGQVHCDLCCATYDVNFDQFIEARFAVHPAVRTLTTDTFCIGAPALSPHILLQIRLAPGETQLVGSPSTESMEFLSQDAKPTFRFRVMRDNKIVTVAAPPSSFSPRSVTRLSYASAGWNLAAASGPFSIENLTEKTINVVLERIEWDQDSITAAAVTARQEFRDLFSSEVLRPGLEIGVENLTFFFSDLGNSTALYEQIGDAAAFRRVEDHFEFIVERIRRHQGAVVKTMGDAVMAVFTSAENGFAAALELRQDFHAFRDTAPELEQLFLKMGLHRGPALVVTQNERLDYFGRSVNLASRVAAASRGSDFVVAESIFQDPAVTELLKAAEVRVNRFEANFRGVPEPIVLYRVSS